MIATVCKRGELANYNLGGLTPPLVELPRKNLELVWDRDDDRWQIYMVTPGTTPSMDTMTWQISVPYKGSLVSKNIQFWLQKYDTTEGGKKDDDQRKQDWLDTFKWVREREHIKREKAFDDVCYESGHRAKFLERLAFGAPQCVVPAGPVVGINKKTGKPVRAYEKPKISKEIIVGG